MICTFKIIDPRLTFLPVLFCVMTVGGPVSYGCAWQPTLFMVDGLCQWIPHAVNGKISVFPALITLTVSGFRVEVNERITDCTACSISIHHTILKKVNLLLTYRFSIAQETVTFSIYALLIQLWGHSINFSCSASFNKYQFQPVLDYSFVWNEGINLLCLVEIWWVPFAGPPVLQRLWICCVKKLQSKSILGQWCWGRSPFREWSKICSPYVFDLLLYSFHSRQSCYHTCCCLYVILASFPSSYFAIWTKIQLKAHLFPMVLTSARWGPTIDAIPVLWQVRSFSNELTKYEPWQISS